MMGVIEGTLDAWSGPDCHSGVGQGSTGRRLSAMRTARRAAPAARPSCRLHRCHECAAVTILASRLTIVRCAPRQALLGVVLLRRRSHRRLDDLLVGLEPVARA